MIRSGSFHRRISPWLIAALTLGADQLTKWAVAASWTPGQSQPFLPPVCYLTYVQNTGAAFGLLKGQQSLFILLSLVMLGVLVWLFAAKPPTSPWLTWAYALVLGGTTGNLVDRLRLGYVVDFIDLRVWPVFNLADSAITIGVGLLLLDQTRLFRQFRLFRLFRQRRGKDHER